METLDGKIGSAIRERRTEAGQSLRALASLVDVDPAYLSRVERGLVPASDALVLGAARALGLDAEELFLLEARIPPTWQSAISASPAKVAGLLRNTVARLASTVPKPPIEREEFPFEHLSRIAEAESWRKEVNRPVYHMHKWWAQRLGSVFRGIILGCFAPPDADVMDLFYQPSRIPQDAVVLDPFMGSGTTVGEVLKLGARAVGRDINPVSCFIVRNAMRPHSERKLTDEFHQIMSSARTRLSPLYCSTADGRQVTAQYYFWVKHVPCPSCDMEVDLFRRHVFSKHTYPHKHPEAKVVCPVCGGINDRSHDVSMTSCDHCGHAFDAARGPARGMYARCPSCTVQFRIAQQLRALGEPPRHRMFAKVWIDADGRRRYGAIEKADHIAMARAKAILQAEEGSWPRVRILPGYNTSQVLNNGYTHWHHMFNDRQLVVLGHLGRAVAAVEDVAVRDLLLCAFSGLLEFNNMFVSFKGEGTGAVRHLFSHHILKPERTPLETNPLTMRGSGTFEGIFRRRVLKALDYARDPFELRVSSGGGRANQKISGLSVPLGEEPASSPEEFARGRRLWLSAGDSASTDIPEGSVDAVITDPPFFDNVNYSELADFFWVWQRHLQNGGRNGVPATTRSDCEVQHRDEDEFARRLGRVWAECRRVLAANGLLVFTYHHSRPEGWTALLVALAHGGFVVTACHPVKSELSLATPKAQARDPIDVDVIFVCRKKDEALRMPVADGFDTILAEAADATRRQVDRFVLSGRLLGRGDVRVTLMAQVLKQLSRRELASATTWLEKATEALEGATTAIVEWQQTQITESSREESLQIRLFQH